MNVPISKLEHTTLETLRRWLLDEHRAVTDINSADLVKTLFGIAGVHPSPIDLTEGVISSVKGEDEMTLRDHIRKQTGLIWTFTTDLGVGACLCKIKDNNNISSLLIILTTGDPGSFTSLRPLVIYNARRVSYYDNNAAINKELEKVNQMFKFTITGDKPATPPKEVKKDELRKEDAAPTGADVKTGQQPDDRGAETGGSRTEEEDNSHPAAHPEETGGSETSDGGTSDSTGAEGNEALTEEEEDNEDDDLTPDEEQTDDAAEEADGATPSKLTSDTNVNIDGTARVRESNWIIGKARELLQSASEGLELEEFTRQITNYCKGINVGVDIVGDSSRIEIMTKPLILTDSEILSYWSSAWIAKHSDGCTAEDQTDIAIAHKFAKLANNRRFIRFERTGELCTIVLSDQEVRFLDPYYKEPEYEAPPEEEKAPEPTPEPAKEELLPADLEKEMRDMGISDSDIQAVKDGKVTAREVIKLHESMTEADADHKYSLEDLAGPVKYLGSFDSWDTFQKWYDAIKESLDTSTGFVFRKADSNQFFGRTKDSSWVDVSDAINEIMRKEFSQQDEAANTEAAQDEAENAAAREPEPEEPPTPEVNVSFTAKTLAEEVIKPIVAGIKEIFRGYKAQALNDLDFQMEGIRNALEKIIGPKVLEFEWEHRYDESTNTIVVKEIVNEPEQEQKEVTIRINCPLALPDTDYQKIKAKIAELRKLPDDEISDVLSREMGYACTVQTVSQDLEYVVTTNCEKEEASVMPADPEPAPALDPGNLAEEMSSLKDAEPVSTDYIDLNDPANRDRVIQVLFPGVTDPAITHLMHFLKEHHRNERTPSFLATKETIPTETTIVYDNFTFAIVKMKDGRFWRIFCAHTDPGLDDHSWVTTNHMEDRWVQLGRDIHDTMNYGGFNNNGFRRGYRR